MNAIRWISRLLAIASGALILAAALLITYAAFARYFFHASSIWKNELSVYLLMASVWLGCGPAMLANRHVAIRLLSRRAPRVVGHATHVLSYLACIVVGAVLVYKGLDVTLQAWHGGWHASTTWGPSLVVPYLIVPLGFAFFVLAAVIRLCVPPSPQDGDDPID